MKPKLILMFTHNDITVPDALDYFEKVKDLPVDFFGFKEAGLSKEKMKYGVLLSEEHSSRKHLYRKAPIGIM